MNATDGATEAGGGHGCDDVQGSCQLAGTCTDYGGYGTATLAAVQQACTASKGTWSADSCDTTGSIGGCKTTTADGCGVVWEFAPLTASVGQTACDKRGAGNVFVSP